MPREAKRLISDATSETYFSAASIWEIAIKKGLRRADFDVDPAGLPAALERSGVGELPVTATHAARVASLARIHRDPFDRLLVAQASSEPMTLLTNDAALSGYGPIVRVV
jgi:PIN domain nuclease of toxin-antitoxin system